MKFIIEIAVDNAAFDGYARDAEVARILRDTATKVDNGVDGGRVYDINGNTVGRFGYTEG